MYPSGATCPTYALLLQWASWEDPTHPVCWSSTKGTSSSLFSSSRYDIAKMFLIWNWTILNTHSLILYLSKKERLLLIILLVAQCGVLNLIFSRSNGFIYLYIRGFSSSCVHYVASFSKLSFLFALLVFSNVY